MDSDEFSNSFDALDVNTYIDDLENTSYKSEDMEEQTAPNSFVEKIMRYFLRHNLTLVGLEDLMDLLNEDKNKWTKFPTSKRLIMNLFRQHREVFDVFYMVKCDKCKFTSKVDSETKKSKCGQCDSPIKKSETSFFVYIPIEQQIIKSIKENRVFVKNSTDNDSYSDVHDGSVLKNVLKQYENSDVNVLSLCLNLDGANKFKSNVLSVWPIQLIQNYLPPEIRFLPNHIIVAGLYYDKKKPNCFDYMLPLIEEIKDLNSKILTIEIEGTEYKFKPIITHCAVDLPAKSLLQETKQYGSYDGCTFCYIPGEAVSIHIQNDSGDEKIEKKMKKKPTKKTESQRKFVRYVTGNESHGLREAKQMMETMLAVSQSESEDAVDGIKGVSCLVGLKYFDIVWSFSVEYMHSCLLGVTKRFLNYFCNTKFKSHMFYIKPKNRAALSKKICAIKPTSNITRKPRNLEQRKNFKASEFRSLLLYYLPVCLPGSIPNEYVTHIRLLSAAVYKLLQKNITVEEVDEAEKMLDQFVQQHQVLFGKENMVMNIHLMSHLAECVRKLGPLWCHSAFGFERNNGNLLKLANGTSHVLHQISYKYALGKSLSSNFKTKSDNNIFLGRSSEIKEKNLLIHNIDETDSVNFSNVPLNVYKRIKLGQNIFTSLLYTRPTKTMDYFVGLEDGTVGTARFYFEHEKKNFVAIEKFEEIDCIHHITKVKKSNKVVMAPVEQIVESTVEESSSTYT